MRCHDARTARETQAALAAAGFEAMALPGAFRPAPDGEDIAIFPFAPDGAAPTDLAGATFKQDNPPFAVLAGLTGATPFPLGLDEVAPFSGATALDAAPKMLASQLEAAMRVAVAEEECARRAATASALATPAPKALEPRKLKALYIGAPSAMFLSLERALGAHGGLVAAAFSSYTGFDHLHDEVFDAVVLNGAKDAQTAISLCAALRRNASLHHLPTMVVTAPGDTATASAAFERGASAVTEANAPCGPSLGWLFEAVRRERRRSGAEHQLRAWRDVMGDPRTGLFQRAPFQAHLARLACDHHASGRSLALAILRVLPAHGACEPSEAAWKKGFGEIASLAGRLMRETDSGAAISDDVIAFAMPASDATGARLTVERIASVAECTAFASGDNAAGPLMFEQNTVELQPGESGAGMLARALRAIEAHTVSA